MLPWIAIGGYLVGVIGASLAFGARLRIASLELELAHRQRMYEEAVRGDHRLARTDVETRSLPEARWPRQ